MPKRKVNYAAGCYYHIYNRGAGRQSIFRTEENYHYLLRTLKKVSAACDTTVIAYSLLPNHYHWCLRQDGDTPAGNVPRRVFGSYSQAFNKAFDRTGTLFEGPYKAIHVTTGSYLQHLCRYIHGNPVRHGLAMAPELWPYSNYLDWMGLRPGTMVDHAFIAKQFGSPEAYRSQLLAYLIGQIDLPAPLRNYLDGLDK